MFTYCLNNPVNCLDSFGENTESIWEWGSVLSVFAVLDAATPFFEIGVAVAAVVGICCLVASIPASKERENNKVIADEKVSTGESSDVVIYRYNATKSKNLAPRPGKDYDGLSFSTTPPKPGQKAVVTTINTVNSTQILTAVQNGTHVSIVPTGAPVESWMALGMNSIWSQTLSSIVSEVK